MFDYYNPIFETYAFLNEGKDLIINYETEDNKLIMLYEMVKEIENELICNFIEYFFYYLIFYF